MLGEPRLNHRPVVAAGLLAEECADLLRAFFAGRGEACQLPPRPSALTFWPLDPGEVAERLNAPVSKTGMGFQSIGGSNPPLSVV